MELKNRFIELLKNYILDEFENKKIDKKKMNILELKNKLLESFKNEKIHVQVLIDDENKFLISMDKNIEFIYTKESDIFILSMIPMIDLMKMMQVFYFLIDLNIMPDVIDYHYYSLKEGIYYRSFGESAKRNFIEDVMVIENTYNNYLMNNENFYNC